MNSPSKSGKKDPGITLLYNDKLGHGLDQFHPLDSPVPDLKVIKIRSHIRNKYSNKITIIGQSQDLD